MNETLTTTAVDVSSTNLIAAVRRAPKRKKCETCGKRRTVTKNCHYSPAGMVSGDGWSEWEEEHFQCEKCSIEEDNYWSKLGHETAGSAITDLSDHRPGDSLKGKVG